MIYFVSIRMFSFMSGSLLYCLLLSSRLFLSFAFCASHSLYSNTHEHTLEYHFRGFCALYSCFRQRPCDFFPFIHTHRRTHAQVSIENSLLVSNFMVWHGMVLSINFANGMERRALEDVRACILTTNTFTHKHRTMKKRHTKNEEWKEKTTN